MAVAKAVASAVAMAMASPPERTLDTASTNAKAKAFAALVAENAVAREMTRVVPPLPLTDPPPPAVTPAVPPSVLAFTDVSTVAWFCCNKDLKAKSVSSLA